MNDENESSKDLDSLTQRWKIQGKRASSSKPSDPCDLRGCIDTTSGIWKSGFILCDLGISDETINILRSEKFAGLINMGSTCYVNSFIQSVFFNADLRSLVLSVDAVPESALHALQSLIADLEFSAVSKVNPKEFLSSFQIRTNLQEDTGEFGTLLLNWLDQQIGNSKIRSLFEGTMTHNTTCTSCSYASLSVEKFLELRVGASIGRIGENAFGHGSELIEGYRCGQDSCAANMSPSAIRTSTITKLPDHLRVMIDRYQFSIASGREKLTTCVEFPMELGLCGLEYSLVGTLEHHSEKASSGHYTTTLKDTETGEWWVLDDTKVERLELRSTPLEKEKRKKTSSVWTSEGCVSSSAYVVLYQRKTSLVEHVRPPIIETVRTEAIRRTESILREIDARKSLRSNVENKIQERKALVSSLSALSGTPALGPFKVTSASYLKTWSCGEDIRASYLPLVGVVANDPTPPRCAHLKISPLEIERGAVKYVPSNFEGIEAEDILCLICSEEIESQLSLGTEYWYLLRQIMAAKYNVIFKAFEEGIEDGSLADHSAVWVYKPDLPTIHPSLRKVLSTRQSLLEKIASANGPSSRSVVDIGRGVVCEHGIIVPEAIDHGDYVLKPKAMIDRLSQVSNQMTDNWFSFLPKIVLDTPLILVDDSHIECTRCSSNALEESSLKTQLENFFREPVLRTSLLVPGQQYFVFPSGWMNRVKSWAFNSTRTCPREVKMDPLLCPHGDLRVDILNMLNSDNDPDGITLVPDHVAQILKDRVCRGDCPSVVIEKDRTYTLGVCPILCSICQFEEDGRPKTSSLSVRVFHEPIDRLESGSNRAQKVDLNNTTVVYRPGRSRHVGTGPPLESQMTGVDIKLWLLEIGIVDQSPFPIDLNEALDRINIYVSHPSIRGALIQLKDEYPIEDVVKLFQGPDSRMTLDTIFVEFTRNASLPSSPKRLRKVPIASDKDAGMQGSILREPS